MAELPESPSSVDLSTEEVRLAVHIARQYFLEDKSKVAIADELGLSRFKVARLLDRARSEGIVTIKIANPDQFDRDLSARLASDLGVPNVLVTDPVLPTSALADVAALAAAHLRTVVTADGVLGVAWSRATRALSEQLAGLPPCTVAQLCGVMPEPDREEHNVELVRRAARACSRKTVTFYAPLVLSTTTSPMPKPRRSRDAVPWPKAAACSSTPTERSSPMVCKNGSLLSPNPTSAGPIMSSPSRPSRNGCTRSGH